MKCPLCLVAAALLGVLASSADAQYAVHADGPVLDMPSGITLTNLNAADTVNADQLWTGGGLGLGLTGSGVRVGIWDGGPVRVTHQELVGRVTVVDAGAAADHATHVAGTIGATGIVSAAHGIAPGVTIRSYNWTNDLTEMNAAASSGLIDLSNHSYTQSRGWSQTTVPGYGYIDVWWGDRSLFTEDAGFGKYDATSAALDTVLYSNPKYLAVWAAGNERSSSNQFTNAHGDNTYITYLSVGVPTPGYYAVTTSEFSAPARDGNSGYDTLSAYQVSKNTLVVGSVADITADPYSTGAISVSSFSSYGPTDDGRIKPDVVGNGEGLYSTLASSNTAYGTMSGTSMADPTATGLAALLIEYYSDLNAGQTPNSATTKALFIHTASDGGRVGPDYQYGWGLIDGAAAASFLAAAQQADSESALFERTFAGVEQMVQLSSRGADPLKVTIVWTDPAGAAQPDGLDDTTPVLVNDLDLWITDAEGNVYDPWTLDPANPANNAVRVTGNHVDNVEQVLIDAPLAGEYWLHIGYTGDTFTQDYSLLISGAIVVPEPATLALLALGGVAFLVRRRRS